jgi:AraC-like DNA-binding protein
MYSSKIVESTDPDLYIASVRPANIEFTVTERGEFHARSTLLNLGRVYGQRGRERLARIKNVEASRGGIIFLARPGPSMFVNGAEMGMDQIAVIGSGEVYTSRLSGATQWGTVTLAKEDLDGFCTPEAGWDVRGARGASVITPSPPALAKLRSLHNHLGCLAEATPEVLSCTELAHDFEHSLLEAMRATLRKTPHESGCNTLRGAHYQFIIKRFRALIEEQDAGSAPMPEISQKIGVSGRTLRLACQHQLGLSPGQYVTLRRMQSVRRALKQAGPDTASVTDIATEHGFWELGRFAVKYRQIFGETPSTTLKKPRYQIVAGRRPIMRTHELVAQATLQTSRGSSISEASG